MTFNKFKMKTYVSRISINRNLSIQLFPDNLEYFNDLKLKKTVQQSFNKNKLIVSEKKVPPMINTPQLNTYDLSGYCTYIPIKPKHGFLSGVMFQIFDRSTKIVFLTTVGATLLVLRLYKVIDSTCSK